MAMDLNRNTENLEPDLLAAVRRERLAHAGLKTISGLCTQIDHLYASGLPRGDSTGWSSLDELMTLTTGRLIIVTGWPSSGKSEFVDALAMNLARQSNWRFFLYSPENHPREVHVAKLIEKFLGKPFGDGPVERATRTDVNAANRWLEDRFLFIDPPGELPTLRRILSCVESAISPGNFRAAKQAVIIDPWNEVAQDRLTGETETEFIGRVLGYAKRWAQTFDTSVILVAHPQKQRNKDGSIPVPRPDMISGSQHWWNKADLAITVHRDQVEGTQAVQIHVQKCRFKHLGRQGAVELLYDRVTGQYHESLVPGMRARLASRGRK